VLRPAREAFRAARDRYLRPYPGVRETLDRLRARGLKVVGLTDAPRNAAELRLKHLKLDGHFDALYTLPGYPLPENVDPEIRRKEEAGHYRSRTPVIELPHAAEKPSPDGLARVLSDFGLAGGEVLYVGDNVKKDMPVADACGAVGVWAEYGTYVSEEYRERLAIISASSVTRRHVAEETALRWPLAISSFTQVAGLADGSAGASPGRGARVAQRGARRRRRGRPGPRAR
jgi:phosphoglycolate phosphatase